MIPAVYLGRKLTLARHGIQSRPLTRRHDHRVDRGCSTTAGGGYMPFGADREEIYVPHPRERSGGKTACAVAIDLHMAKTQY